MQHDKKTVGEDWRQLFLDYYAQFVLQLAPESRSKAIQDYITSLLSQIKDEVEQANEGTPAVEYEAGFDYGMKVAAKIITKYIGE